MPTSFYTWYSRRLQEKQSTFSMASAGALQYTAKHAYYSVKTRWTCTRKTPTKNGKGGTESTIVRAAQKKRQDKKRSRDYLLSCGWLPKGKGEPLCDVGRLFFPLGIYKLGTANRGTQKKNKKKHQLLCDIECIKRRTEHDLRY